jgi:hypothetical protein
MLRARCQSYFVKTEKRHKIVSNANPDEIEAAAAISARTRR